MTDGEEGFVGTMHPIRQGESAESVAHEAGHLCETVWNDPANAELKQARESPHVLLPGDSLFVPDIEPKTVQCATGRKYTFKRKGVPSKLRVRFLTDGKPRAGKPYSFVIDGAQRQGTTDGDGWLEETLSPDAVRAVVQFAAAPPVDADPAAPDLPEAYTYVLNLRHLDPATEVTGAQARLRNLGYPCGDVDGVLGPRTKEALSAFQTDNGLDVTGEVDEATKNRLQTFAKG
jgi:hypothetical protein